DIEAIDLLAGRTRLMGDEGRAEKARRFGLHVVERFHDLDAAGLAASTGMDLRLDDVDGTTELLRGGDRLIGRERGNAARHRHAILRKHGLGLIFMDVHGRSVRAGGAARSAAPMEKLRIAASYSTRKSGRNRQIMNLGS